MLSPPRHRRLDNISSAGLLFNRELKAAALEATTANAQLMEAARAGDRLAIIEAVSKALPAATVEFSPEQLHLYEAKDETKAAELLKREQLSEALAWAPPKSKLFGQILARRIRHYYTSGELARCVRDCRYYTAAAQRQHEADDAVAAEQQQQRVEVLLLHANCSKAAGEPPEVARNLLNEAMRGLNELALSPSAKAGILRSVPPPATAAAASKGPVSPSPRPGPLLGKPHEFLSCCSDALALSRDLARGRFLYATRNIKAGSVLIVDRPYSFSTDLSALGTNCANCHVSFRAGAALTQIPCTACATCRYCSEECRQQAWDEFHKYECRIFKYLYDQHDLQKCNAPLAYRTVVTALKGGGGISEKDFARLADENNSCSSSFDDLETHCVDQLLEDLANQNLEQAICSIFLARCLIYSLRHLGCLKFKHLDSLCAAGKETLESDLATLFLRSIQAIKCNAYEIVENVRNEETKIFEPRNVGGAIYTSVSLTNHSCYPNVVRHCFPSGLVAVTALRFIPKGAEILDCYGQHFLENERDHRRRHLKRKYYFECKCVACSLDWPTTLQHQHDLGFKCKQKISSKLYNSLQTSIEQKRVGALTKMYDGCYNDALPLLLEHSNFIDKILLEPSLEAVKTQQSIIQCLNAMSCTSN